MEAFHAWLRGFLGIAGFVYAVLVLVCLLFLVGLTIVLAIRFPHDRRRLLGELCKDTILPLLYYAAVLYLQVRYVVDGKRPFSVAVSPPVATLLAVAVFVLIARWRKTGKLSRREAWPFVAGTTMLWMMYVVPEAWATSPMEILGPVWIVFLLMRLVYYLQGGAAEGGRRARENS